MNKKILVNYFYTLCYQLLLVVLPIITMPYKARVLGPENIGIYSYVLSVVNYLIILGSLGIDLYGRREVAYLKSKCDRSKLLFELLGLKIIVYLIVIISFFLLFGLKSKYFVFYIILLPDMFFSVFDITWFFQGIEEFKRVSIVNFFIRILNVIFIFLFIKNCNHLTRYFIITVFFDILTIIIFLLQLSKYVQKVDFKSLKFLRHIRPAIVLFLPQICIRVYTVCDKIMLGNFQHNIDEVGFYEYSDKIIQILINVISALSVVIIPVISKEFANRDEKRIKKYINASINLCIFLALPLTFGIVSISTNLVIIVFGYEYLKMHILIKILAFSILPISITTIIGNSYLIPTKQEMRFTFYVFIGALSNVVLNFLLINFFSSVGTAFATIITEIIIVVIEIPILRKLIKVKEMFLNLGKYFLYSVIMFIIVYCIGLCGSNIYVLIIQIISGVFIYVFFLLFSHDVLLFNVIERIKR